MRRWNLGGKVWFVQLGRKGGSQNPQITEHQPILRWGRWKILILEIPKSRLFLLESPPPTTSCPSPWAVVNSLGFGSFRLSSNAQDPTRLVFRFPVPLPCHLPFQPSPSCPSLAPESHGFCPPPRYPSPTVTDTDRASQPYFPIPKSRVTFHANHHVVPFLSLFRARFMLTPSHLF